MHHNGIRRSEFQVVWMKAEVDSVLAQRWKERCVLSFTLDPQNDDYVSSFNGVLNAAFESQPVLDDTGEIRRNKRARTSDTNRRAEFCQQVDIRARDARMKDVTNDGDFQSGDLFLVITDC